MSLCHTDIECSRRSACRMSERISRTRACVSMPGSDSRSPPVASSVTMYRSTPLLLNTPCTMPYGPLGEGLVKAP